MTTQLPDEAVAARKLPWLRLSLGVASFLVIAIIAIRTIDREHFLEALRALRPAHLVAILAVSLAHIAGRAMRYHWLVTAARPSSSYRLRDGFRIFLVGLSASAVTPARAGDFIKAKLISRYGIDTSVGFGLVLVERMVDLLVIAGFVVFSGVLLSGNAASDAWQASAWTFAIALISGILILSSKKIREILLANLAKALAKILRSDEKIDALQAKLSGLFEVWDLVFSSPIRLGGILGASAAIWAIEFTKLWLVLYFLQAPCPLLVVYFVYPVSIVAGIVSLLPFSEGVVGLTSVALLGTLAGVGSGAAALGITVDRTASALPPILLWAIFAAIGRASRSTAKDTSSPR